MNTVQFLNRPIPELKEYPYNIQFWVLVGPNGEDLDYGPVKSNRSQSLIDFLHAAFRNLFRRNAAQRDDNLKIAIKQCKVHRRQDRGPGYFVSINSVRSFTESPWMYVYDCFKLDWEAIYNEELKKFEESQVH